MKTHSDHRKPVTVRLARSMVAKYSAALADHRDDPAFAADIEARRAVWQEMFEYLAKRRRRNGMLRRMRERANRREEAGRPPIYKLISRGKPWTFSRPRQKA